MIKRTVEISREPAHVAVRNRQLILSRNGAPVASIPCEDIGVVVVDHPAVSYTHAALAELAAHDAALVVCGRDHLPAAVLLPLADHSQVVWRVTDQIAAARPLRKRLWQQIVQEKIRAQARNLASASPARSKLLALARAVRSGDPANSEAQAARVYWLHWLGEETFRRDADAAGLNAFLNYGYAVMRAAVARAIVAAGMLPALGLFHSNRGNAFCLADDLVEPLRPLVDAQVREMRNLGYEELNQEAKKMLLELLASEVMQGASRGPLLVALQRYAASLAACFAGEATALEIPVACS